MPVNFFEHKAYSIDYDKLYNELMENIILDNVKLQRDYLKLWIEKLKCQDQRDVEQFEDETYIASMLKEDFEAPEKFMSDISYKTGTIGIFFKISRIIQLIKVSTYGYNIQYIPLKDFTDFNSRIIWCATDLLDTVKNDPIILAPLAINKKTRVVIDGNHRLTVWEKEKRQEIPCYILDGQILVDYNMFCSEFCKLMYIFQNESNTLGAYTIRDHINAEYLIDKIYFKTGKLLYNV